MKNAKYIVHLCYNDRICSHNKTKLSVDVRVILVIIIHTLTYS